MKTTAEKGPEVKLGSNNNNSRLIGSWKEKKEKGGIRRKGKKTFGNFRFCVSAAAFKHGIIGTSTRMHWKVRKKTARKVRQRLENLYTRHFPSADKCCAYKFFSRPFFSPFYGGIRKQSAIVKINLGGGGGGGRQ